MKKKSTTKKISAHDAYLMFSSPDNEVQRLIQDCMQYTMEEIERIDSNAVCLYAGECHPGMLYDKCARVRCILTGGTSLSDVSKRFCDRIRRGKKAGHVLLFRTLPELCPRPEHGIVMWCTFGWTKVEHTIDLGGRPLGFNVFDNSTKRRLGLIR